MRGRTRTTVLVAVAAAVVLGGCGGPPLPPPAPPGTTTPAPTTEAAPATTSRPPKPCSVSLRYEADHDNVSFTGGGPDDEMDTSADDLPARCGGGPTMTTVLGQDGRLVLTVGGTSVVLPSRATRTVGPYRVTAGTVTGSAADFTIHPPGT